MKRRVLNKKKIIKAIFVIYVLVLIIIGITITSSYSKTNVKYREEFVSSGDTLWDISLRESESNKYFEGKDIREIIYEIKKFNNLTNSSLTINQKLLIPTI